VDSLPGFYLVFEKCGRLLHRLAHLLGRRFLGRLCRAGRAHNGAEAGQVEQDDGEWGSHRWLSMAGLSQAGPSGLGFDTSG
jgi:hypothetical protein